MDDFTATMAAEGQWELAGLEPTTENALAAWQHLVDTGLAWKLQGFFGRTATRLIAEGFIRPASCDPRVAH